MRSSASGSRIVHEALLVSALLLPLPHAAHAATGTGMHFQTDVTGYTGFGTAPAIDTRRGQAVLFSNVELPSLFRSPLRRIVFAETMPADVSAAGCRVRWQGPRGATVGGAIHVVRAVPTPPPTGPLALGPPRPNPVTSSAVLDHRLPASEPATIRLYDLRGGSVRKWTVQAPGAPSWPIDLRGVRPGLHVQGLEQGARNTSVRVAIVR